MINFIRNNVSFAKLAGVNLFSKIGDRLFYTAMLTAASMVDHAKLAIMLVSISETFPIVLSFLLGNMADRKANKSKLMAINALLRMIIYVFIGILFHFPLTFHLVTLVIILNFLSGVLGNYSSALIAPFTKILVASADMEQAQGIISLSSQLVNIIATFGGSILMTIFIFQQVAWINAVVFLVVLGGIRLLKNLLRAKEKTIHISNNHNHLLVDIKDNFKALTSNKRLLNDIVQLMMINGFFGGLMPIFVISLGQSETIHGISKPIWIALLSGVITAAMIIGNTISGKHFRNIDNYYLNNFCNVLIIISGIMLILQNLFLIVVISGLIGVVLGIVSPRSTKVINNYPVEKLGGIVTTVNSLLIITPPLASTIFPLLSSLNTMISYLAFSIYGSILIIVSIILIHNQKTPHNH